MALIDPLNGATDTGDGIAALVIALVANVVYGRVAVWARVLLSLLFGLAGIAGGIAMHVVPALENGPSGADFERLRPRAGGRSAARARRGAGAAAGNGNGNGALRKGHEPPWAAETGVIKLS